MLVTSIISISHKVFKGFFPGVVKSGDCVGKGSYFKLFPKEYMPKSRPGLGIGTLPNGKKNYEACLKWHTSLNDTPDMVHEKGKQEVIRIEQRIQEVV